MAKVTKIGNQVIAFLSNGESIQRENLTNEELLKLLDCTKDEEVLEIMDLKLKDDLKEYRETKKVVDNIKKSSILTFRNDSAYWEEVSSLTVPEELVKSILDAEEKNDEVRLETYKNFWTLMSLNPDETCRKNLFWYLMKNELIISRSGFFVSYRNVATTNEKGVYTDNYSHTMKIRIGEMVTMDRKDCDCNSNVTCSRGLICSPLYQ